jgi:hypothetical protein
MSSTIDGHTDVARYLAGVRSHLTDLTDAERDDLLAEVEASLVETAADSGSIDERLGSPAEFAQELRTAAGLAPADPPRPTRRAPAMLAAVARRLRTLPYLDLAPVWWMLRAYVVVGALGFVVGWAYRHPAVPRIVDARVTAVLFAAAVIASIWIGRRERGRLRLAVVANLVVAALAVPVLVHAATATSHEVVFVETAAPATPGLVYDGVQIDNIYAYTLAGKMLHDVLLYDGRGKAIDIGGPQVVDPNRRVLRTRGDAPIFNSFPIRYYEPWTRTVAHPNAGPPIVHTR